MTYKTPADMASANYCYEHRIYFDSGMCPDCTLERWATFKEPTDPKTQEFVKLDEI